MHTNQSIWTPLPSKINITTTYAQPPPYPLLVSFAMGMVIGGRAVYCGGAIDTGTNTKQCLSLNPTNNAWESFTNLPLTLSCASSTMTPSGWWLAGRLY
jgi:hypothetical protein